MALARGVRQRRFDCRDPYGLVLVLRVFVSSHDDARLVLEGLECDERLAFKLSGIDLKGDLCLTAWLTRREASARLCACDVNPSASLRVDERAFEGVWQSGYKALV